MTSPREGARRAFAPTLAALVASMLATACGRIDAGTDTGAGTDADAGTDAGTGTGTGTGTDADTGTDAGAGTGAREGWSAGVPPAGTTDAGADAATTVDPAAVLQTARIHALVPSGGGGVQRGMFDATLEVGDAPPIAARAALAMRSAPVAYRRPLAFWRLARALGLDAVAPTVVRALPIAEVSSLLAGRPDVLGTLGARAAIRNDGTVDALISVAPPPDGQPVALDARAEVRAWQRWSIAAEPVDGEDTSMLRAYVAMLVLDYLSGNVGRRTIWLDSRSGRIQLDDNATSFPLRSVPSALDHVLRRLREVARFPRGLRGALAALDRNAAWALFNPGDFDTWLLPPRTLVELDERRAGVLTLIDARVSERGEAAVMSL